MDNTKDCYELLEKINKRLESTEELLKILSVNELLGEISCDSIEKLVLDKNIIDIAEEEGFQLYKQEVVSGNLLIYLRREKTLPVSSLIELFERIRQIEENVIPVFVFERLYGRQRRTLQDRKISFLVKEKELHIYI